MERNRIRVRSIQYVYDPKAGRLWLDVLAQALYRSCQDHKMDTKHEPNEDVNPCE
ncbi:hypothetical protein [Ferroacidibacillus organovorans]|uniref:hypothetical protein n=1 Tax=Ferroacidibacillus organovorans TaxID=1765683 RepID=UPI0012E77481|nr:hypothetical protein [Ferroacidibacillus organovorans]